MCVQYLFQRHTGELTNICAFAVAGSLPQPCPARLLAGPFCILSGIFVGCSVTYTLLFPWNVRWASETSMVACVR